MTIERAHTLDAMRGLAALAVVMHHIGWNCGLPVFREGYLAVDFFFALSGYVIASAYRQRLGSGLSFTAFAETRLIRLYPLFILGIVLGFFKSLAQLVLGDAQALTRPDLALATILNAIMLPAPIGRGALFPLNAPDWSLFMEMVINLVYAAGLFRLRVRGLAPLMLAAALVLVRQTLRNGEISAGVDWGGFAGGCARTAFSFGAGLVIHQVVGRIRHRPGWWACLPMAGLIAILATSSGVGQMPFFDLTVVFLALPFVVLAGTVLEVPARLKRPAELLGDISYPIYAVHFPLVVGGWFVARRFISAPVFAALTMPALVVLAWLLARFYDEPVRRWLSARMKLRFSARLQSV